LIAYFSPNNNERLIFFCYSEIWNRFLEFESNVGDLASIVKVEKRRSAVLEKVFFFIPNTTVRHENYKAYLRLEQAHHVHYHSKLQCFMILRGLWASLSKMNLNQVSKSTIDDLQNADKHCWRYVAPV
jgi:hypothetical protein